MNVLYLVLVILVAAGCVLSDDGNTTASKESNRTARWNRNERHNMVLRPPGQPNVHIQERPTVTRYNGKPPPQQRPFPQTMQQISTQSGESQFSSNPNHYPKPNPSVRVNVVGPARVILHNPHPAPFPPRNSHSPQPNFKPNGPHPHYNKPMNAPWSKYPPNPMTKLGQKHQPVPFKRDEFRPSQQIKVYEAPTTDAPAAASTLTDDQLHNNQLAFESLSAKSEQPVSYFSVKQYIQKPDDFLKFTAGDNVVDETENTWQPSVPSFGYPQHIDSAEIQQYQTQDRISFYPDKHPEYFQPHFDNEPTYTFKPEIPTTTTSRPVRRKPQSGTMKSSRYKLKKAEEAFEVNGPTESKNIPSKIKPVYEYDLDDNQQPAKRYSQSHDIDVDNDTNDNIYQSVLVSSSLQTSADHANNDEALYVTPPKPDAQNDIGPIITTPSTTTTQHSGNRTGSMRKHNRVFKRKFVPPPTLDSDSCEETCLSNIVSRVFDPVCGSDNKNYENVGRLRCTKICGAHHLHVAHFGSCDGISNALGTSDA